MTILSLLTTALLLGSSLASPPPISTSRAFHLLLIPLDPFLPISALSTIHTGAGQSLVVAFGPPPAAADQQQQHIVLYQNSTGHHQSSSIARDVLPQGFPMTLLFSPPAPEDTPPDQPDQPGQTPQSVSLTVSGSTPLSIPPGSPPTLTHNPSAPGAFYVCDTWVPYYRAAYPVLSWSDDGAADRCFEVRAAPVCEVLEELPPDALGSHEFVQEVGCFVDDGAARDMYGRA